VIDPLALFDTIEPPDASAGSHGLVFSTAPLPGWPAYHVGRTSSGEAALLIETEKGDRHPPPPIRLQSLAVYHDALCRVSVGGRGFEDRIFTVVWNTGGEPTLRRYFLGLTSAIAVSLGKQPTPQRVFEAVDALAELFRVLARPPRKSTQGLWAELLLIAQAADALALARAWHGAPDDRFDFNAGAQRIEVKSAGATRRHHFALDQLRAPAGVEIMIASILTTRATGGTSLETLLNRVLGRLSVDPKSQAHVHRVVAETLGSNLSAGLGDAYDEQLGRESLQFFRAEDVPSVVEPIPAQVSEVRFLADISDITPVDKSHLAARNGLFSAGLT
jgi:hypothetical protein